MLLIGASGHAKEVAQILFEDGLKSLVFFDEFTEKDQIWGCCPIISSNEDVKSVFASNPQFILALGNPENRRVLYNKFVQLGGSLTSVIASNCKLGSFGVELGEGVNIMQYVLISCDVRIDKGVLINARANIHHDVQVGAFCEIGPAACLLGGVALEESVFVGAGAVILPRVKLGAGSVVGAGAVVKENVPPYTLVTGVPATFKKQIKRS